MCILGQLQDTFSVPGSVFSSLDPINYAPIFCYTWCCLCYFLRSLDSFPPHCPKNVPQCFELGHSQFYCASVRGLLTSHCVLATGRPGLAVWDCCPGHLAHPTAGPPAAPAAQVWRASSRGCVGAAGSCSPWLAGLCLGFLVRDFPWDSIAISRGLLPTPFSAGCTASL